MGKQWVIPDIHGHYKTLKALVEQQVQPAKDDVLFFLGDYIDRGPDSKKVIDYLRKLQDEGYNLKLLLGNHEDYCIRAYDEAVSGGSFLGIKSRNLIKKEWMAYGGKQTLKSFGARNVRSFPVEYIDWMRKLEYYIQLEDYILVHAGFNFGIDDPFADKTAMLWVRDYNVKTEKINNKSVIHGHVPVSLEFLYMTIQSDNYDFIALDNGVYLDARHGFGNLTALELGTKTLLIQPNLDE